MVLSGCGATNKEPAPIGGADGVSLIWTAIDGIDAPENAYWDTASGFLFVSQVTGKEDARDGTGRISKLNGQDGKVISANWVTKLNAPKGLRSHNGVLWTADIDEVIGIEISSG